MHDIHCHILPEVDDGSRTLYESLAMIRSAARAGVTHIVATPHCRNPYFDYSTMVRSYRSLKQALELEPAGSTDNRSDSRSTAAHPPIRLSMGFEVYHDKLMELGLDWVGRLHAAGSHDFLLELSTRADEIEFRTYERTITQLRGMGMNVIVAHPERYGIVQSDLSYAKRLCDLGCQLQLSARSLGGKRFGRLHATSRKLINAGLYTHIASDAHCPEDYELFERAVKKWGREIIG